jgi:hypothetical protein
MLHWRFQTHEVHFQHSRKTDALQFTVTTMKMHSRNEPSTAEGWQSLVPLANTAKVNIAGSTAVELLPQERLFRDTAAIHILPYLTEKGMLLLLCSRQHIQFSAVGHSCWPTCDLKLSKLCGTQSQAL